MSAPRISLLMVFAFACGTFLGWQASRDRAAGTGDAGVSLPQIKTERSDAIRRLPPLIGKLLEPVRAARTDDERMRATLALAAAIPLAELEQWLGAKWFGRRELMESVVFERILLDRWLEADPAGLVGYLMKTDHPEFNSFVWRWAQHDPAGSFAFFRSGSRPDEFQRMIWAAGDIWEEKIPEVLADEMPWLMEALGIVSVVRVSAWIDLLAQNRPELISSRAGEWPEELRRMATISLDRAALRKGFSSALAALLGEENGKIRLMGAIDGETDLIEKLLAHESQLPPGWFAEMLSGRSHYISVEDPVRWLEADLIGIGLPEDDARRLRLGAIHNLSGNQPEEALKILEKGLLTEGERRALIIACFNGLSIEGSEGAEALLGRLLEPEEIALAREQIEFARVSVQRMQVRSIPEWIASFSHESEHAEESVAAVWDSRQAMEAAAAFDALPPAEKGKIAVNLLEEAGSEIPPELTAVAYGYLLGNPPEGDDAFPEAVNVGISDLANEWATRDPLAASRWVSSLPEGQARLWAAKNLAARWAEYEPAAARNWVSTLPTGDRFEVVDYLNSGEAWTEPDE